MWHIGHFTLQYIYGMWYISFNCMPCIDLHFPTALNRVGVVRRAVGGLVRTSKPTMSQRLRYHIIVRQANIKICQRQNLYPEADFVLGAGILASKLKRLKKEPPEDLGIRWYLIFISKCSKTYYEKIRILEWIFTFSRIRLDCSQCWECNIKTPPCQDHACRPSHIARTSACSLGRTALRYKRNEDHWRLRQLAIRLRWSAKSYQPCTRHKRLSYCEAKENKSPFEQSGVLEPSKKTWYKLDGLWFMTMVPVLVPTPEQNIRTFWWCSSPSLVGHWSSRNNPSLGVWFIHLCSKFYSFEGVTCFVLCHLMSVWCLRITQVSLLLVALSKRHRQVAIVIILGRREVISFFCFKEEWKIKMHANTPSLCHIHGTSALLQHQFGVFFGEVSSRPPPNSDVSGVFREMFDRALDLEPRISRISSRSKSSILAPLL